MRVVFYFFLFITFSIITISFGQNQNTTKYHVFAKDRSTVPKALRDSLKNEANSLKRFQLIDSIASIHIEFGFTDSIISYGQLLEKEVEFNTEELFDKPYWLGKAYIITGEGKRLNGLFDAALSYHFKAIELVDDYEALYHENRLGMAKNYFNKKNYDKALQLFLDLDKNSNDLSTAASASLWTAVIYRLKAEYTIADEHIVVALEKAEKANDQKLQLLIQLFKVRFKINDLDDYEIIDQLITIKDTCITQEYYDIYIETIIDISKMYRKTDNLQAAEVVLSTAHVNTWDWNRWDLEKKVKAELIDFYVEEKNYENAYALMNSYNALNERIIKNQNFSAVKELEIKYETEEIGLERDRQRLIKNSLLIGFLVLLGPVIALLITYYQKLKTQIALNESQEEVNQQKVTGLLKDQELKLIKASVAGENKERKRIAQELHDSIGGNLASIKLQLAYKETASPTYKEIAKQLDDTYNQVRDLSHNLTAKKFEQNVFTELVSEYVQNINSVTDTEISFHPHPVNEVNTIKQHIQIEIFKVVQELLTNALKHSRATSIEIHLNVYKNKLTMLFEDDGVGFDANTVTLGVGLNSMKNRINNISGTMLIDAIPRRGTVINIEIPV